MASIYDLPGRVKGTGNPAPEATTNFAELPGVSPEALSPLGLLQYEGSQFNGWSDLGHQFTSGAGDTAAMLSSVVGYIANQVDPSGDNVLATTMDEWRKVASDWADGEREKISPSTMALLQGPALESFGRNPLWWLAGQTANMAPMLVGATALAALTGLAATSAGASAGVAAGVTAGATFGAFGTLSAGDAINQINTAIDNVSDEQLRDIHPLYEKYRDEGMSESEARRALSRDVAGLAPAAAFAIGGLSSLVGGPAQIAAMINRTSAGSIVRGGFVNRLAGGGALGATANAAEAATTTGLAQGALDQSGIQPFDNEAFVNDIVTEALVGGVIGSGAEVLAGPSAGTRRQRAAKENQQSVILSQDPIGPDLTQSAAMQAKPSVSMPDPTDLAVTSVGNQTPPRPAPQPVPVAASPVEQTTAPVPVPAPTPAPVAQPAPQPAPRSAPQLTPVAVPEPMTAPKPVATAPTTAPTPTVPEPTAPEPTAPEPTTAVPTTEATAPVKPVVTDKAHRAVFSSVTASKGENGKAISTAIREVAKLAKRDSKDLRAELQKQTHGMEAEAIRAHIRNRLVEIVTQVKRENPDVTNAPRGSHNSAADRDARRNLNTAAKQIVDANPPADGDAAAMAPANRQNAAGMKETSRARDAVKARVFALTKAYLELGKPEGGGYKLPQRDKTNINSDLDHSPELLLLLEAKRLNDKITGGRAVASDYGRFLTREQQLRSGDPDQIANVRETRRVDGAAARKTAAKGAVETAADTKNAEVTSGTDADAPGERVATKVPKSATRPLSEGKVTDGTRSSPASEVRKVQLSPSEIAAIEARVNAKKPESALEPKAEAPRAESPKGRAAVERVRAKAAEKRIEKKTEKKVLTEKSEPKPDPLAGKSETEKDALWEGLTKAFSEPRPSSAEILAEMADKRVARERARAANLKSREIAKAALQTETGLTSEQRATGNYKKGRVELDEGVTVAIENPKGSTRTAADGSWSVKMPAHYGEIEGSRGADGDKVDVYIGDYPESDLVFVIDQNDAETGAFDEHKVMWGYRNLASAMETYTRAFSDGRASDRFGGVTTMTRDEFRKWLKSDRTKKPSDDQVILAKEMKSERGPRHELLKVQTRDGSVPPYVTAYNEAVRWLNDLSDAAYIRLREQYGAESLTDVLDNADTPQQVRLLQAEMQETLDGATPKAGTQADQADNQAATRILDIRIPPRPNTQTRAGRRDRGPVHPGQGLVGALDARAERLILSSERDTATLDSGVVRRVTGDEALSTIGNDARERLAKHLLGPLQRAMLPTVLQRLRALAGDVPVNFVEPTYWYFMAGKDGTRGMYFRTKHSIYVPEDANPQVIVHELAHAAFMRSMVHDPYAQQNVDAIMAEASDLSGEYGMTNRDEFIAEALSNRVFAEHLAMTEASPELVARLNLRERNTLWGALIAAIRRALKLPNQSHSLLDAILKVAEDLEMVGATPGRFTREDLLLEGRQQFGEASTRLIISDVQRAATTAVTDAVDTLRGRNMTKSNSAPRAMGLRTMDQIVAAARSMNLFNDDAMGRLFNAVQRVAARSVQIEQSWMPEVVGLKKLVDKYAGPVADEFSSLMVDSTIAGVWPNKPLTDKANSHVTKGGYTDAWVRAQHGELAKRFNALPAELKSAYQTHAKHYADAQNRATIEVMRNRILTALGVHDDAMAQRIFNGTETDADKNALGDAYDLIKDTLALGRVDGPYFPLMRHGKYVVRGWHKVVAPQVTSGGNYLGRESGEPDAAYVFRDRKEAERFAVFDERGRVRQLKPTITSKVVDANTGSPWGTMPDGSRVRISIKDVDAERRYYVRIQNQHTEFVDSETVARKLAFSLEQHGLERVDVQPREYQPGSLRGAFMSSDLRKVAESIEKGDAYKEMTSAQQREIKMALDHMALRLLGENRIQSRSLPRRNVAGASKDIVKNAAIYNSALSNYIARLEYGGEVDAAMDVLQQQARANDGSENSAARMAIYNEMKKRLEANSQITGDSLDHHPVIKRVLQWSFVDKLASPAYSVVNAAQPAMISFPILSGRHGVGATLRAMQRAYSDVGALDMFRTGVKDTLAHIVAPDGQHVALVDVLLARAKNDGERRMIQFLVDHNSINPDAGFEIQALTPDATGLVGKVDNVGNYLSQIARQLPRAVEVVNRGVTALAAYRLEIAKSGDHARAVQYAQQITNMTQGNYTAQNAPPIFNHPLAALSLQFKKYGQMMYGVLGHEIGRAIRNANPGDRAEAIKALSTLAAMHIAVAGTLGLPTEPFKWLLMGANLVGATSLTWSDIEDWERQVLASVLGKDLGEVVARGVTRALPDGFAFDTSSRLGMADLLSFGEPRSNDQDDVKAYLFDLVGGAPTSLAMDMHRGVMEFMDGDYVKGVSRLVPIKVMADSIGAVQKAFGGKVSQAGTQTLEPYSLPEAVIRGFGFTPAREAETNDMQSTVFRATARLSRDRTELQQRWFKSTPAERMRLWGQIEAWNRQQPPGNKLTRAQLQSYVKRRKADERAGRVTDGLRVTRQNSNIVKTAQGTYVF